MGGGFRQGFRLMCLEMWRGLRWGYGVMGLWGYGVMGGLMVFQRYLTAGNISLTVTTPSGILPH